MCNFKVELNFLPSRKDGKPHPYKVIIRWNKHMRVLIHFLNSDACMRWHQSSLCQERFLKWKKIKVIIQKVQSFVEECYKVSLSEEVNEENKLLIVNKMHPLKGAVYIKPNFQEVTIVQNCLNNTQQNQWTKLLLKHECLLQLQHDNWTGNQ